MHGPAWPWLLPELSPETSTRRLLRRRSAVRGEGDLPLAPGEHSSFLLLSRKPPAASHSRVGRGPGWGPQRPSPETAPPRGAGTAGPAQATGALREQGCRPPSLRTPRVLWGRASSPTTALLGRGPLALPTQCVADTAACVRWQAALGRSGGQAASLAPSAPPATAPPSGRRPPGPLLTWEQALRRNLVAHVLVARQGCSGVNNSAFLWGRTLFLNRRKLQ